MLPLKYVAPSSNAFLTMAAVKEWEEDKDFAEAYETFPVCTALKAKDERINVYRYLHELNKDFKFGNPESVEHMAAHLDFRFLVTANIVSKSEYYIRRVINIVFASLPAVSSKKYTAKARTATDRVTKVEEEEVDEIVGNDKTKDKGNHKKLVNEHLDAFRHEYDPKKECYIVALASPVNDYTLPLLTGYSKEQVIVTNPEGRDAFCPAPKATVLPVLMSEYLSTIASLNRLSDDASKGKVNMPRLFFYLDYCCTFMSNSASRPAADVYRLLKSGLIRGKEEGSLVWITLSWRKEGRRDECIIRSFRFMKRILEETGHEAEWLAVHEQHAYRKKEMKGYDKDEHQALSKTGKYDLMYYWILFIYKKDSNTKK